MEFLAALLGALVGALGGGAATYWAAVRMWRRDRQSQTMEQFYSQAHDWIDGEHPYQGSRRNVNEHDLYHSAAMLSLYAPGRVSDAAYAITRDVFGILEDYHGDPTPDEQQDNYDRLSGLLQTYEAEMRRALHLKNPEDQKAIEG